MDKYPQGFFDTFEARILTKLVERTKDNWLFYVCFHIIIALRAANWTPVARLVF